MTHKKSRSYAADGVAKTRYAARYLTFVAILLMFAISASAQEVMPDYSTLPTGWTTDRYEPASFTNVGTFQGRPNVLGIAIDNTTAAANRPPGQQGTFYNTQGRKFTFSPKPGPGSTLSAMLYIPASWASEANGSVRTDVWGTMEDAGSSISAYPIIGFTNYSDTGNGTGRLRVYDVILGVWTDLPNPVAYNGWTNLSIRLNADTSIDYLVNGTVVNTQPSTNSSVAFREVIMQAYNFDDSLIPDKVIVPYTAHWSNVSSAIMVDDDGVECPLALTTIGAAVASAANGDTIQVCPGTYIESPQITKSLTIQSTGGRNVTNVQLLPSGSPGTGYLAGFYINSATADVVIDGFTIIGNDAANPVLANSNVVIQTANSVTVTNSRLKVGAIDSGSNGDDGIGVLTTYASGAGPVTVTNNEIMPVNASGARAFYINPATGTSISFQNNQITGHFANNAATECGGMISNNTITGTGASGGFGASNFGGPACGDPGPFTNNSVTGAATGVRIRGANNTVFTSNSFTGNGIGIWFDTDTVTGTVVHYNRIANNTTAGIQNDTPSVANAENNWWGCNYGPGASGSGCPVAANGITGSGAASVDADPWLTLTSSASAPVVVFSGTSNVNSALTMNSLGADTSGGGNVPNGTPATYVATLGTAAPNPSTTTAGLTQTVFTAGVVPGAGGVATTVDGQTLNVPIGVYANLCATVSTPVLTSLPNVPISIPINIDETSGRGIIGFDVTLTYETDTLTPGGITATLGPVASGAGYNINTSTPGTIIISIYNSTPFSGAGKLIDLNFTNTGGIGNSTPLTLSGLMLNGTLVCGTTTSGSLTIISGNMTGKVTYENHSPGYPVPNVNLNAPGPPAVAGLTDVNGDYTLSGFGAGPQTVTPSKAPMNWLTPNGIFSDDAALISQHVVALITLNPVQLRAGKVSGNLTPVISSFDAALIAQWIVGISNPINQTGKWTFTNTSNTYPNVDVNITGQDYLALLLGDVTGDWATGPLARPASWGMMPSENAVRASVDASEAEKGSIVNIPFKIENLKGAPVTSYQFDIEYDPNVLEADRVAATVEETVSSGLSVVSNAPKPGLLKVVVFGAMPVTSDGVYVNLKFAAIGEIGSRSPINIRGFRFNDGSAETTTADSEVVVTAAKNIGIKGRLLTAMGEPVAADVTLSAFGKRGVVGTTRSGADGRFEFGGLDVGRTYTIKVRSKEYRFEPVIVSYADNAVNLDLIALP